MQYLRHCFHEPKNVFCKLCGAQSAIDDTDYIRYHNMNKEYRALFKKVTFTLAPLTPLHLAKNY